MVKNTIANLKVIRKVALALGSLNKQVVYVGGATVSFYINDPAAEDVRPTKDLDIRQVYQVKLWNDFQMHRYLVGV